MATTETRSDFATRLYDLRARNGLTQQKLATLIGVTQQSIWKWETDRSEPNIEKLRRLSELFKVPTDMLLGLSDMSDPIAPATGGAIEEMRATGRAPRTRRLADDDSKRASELSSGASVLVRASELEDVVRQMVLRYLHGDSKRSYDSARSETEESAKASRSI
ncbi:MAG: helix-turn-helix domain-containing protein [Oscillospiraceae bacterium]|nr:helix-turn-helix domain-containing protein [Oscillospiraceae bacterium]